MIIAIDYDGTYSLDPPTFDSIIAILKSAGHTALCITYRSSENIQPVQDSIGKLCPVIMAGAGWKREAAEKAGYKVDVFVDDMPSSIERQMILGQ